MTDLLDIQHVLASRFRAEGEVPEDFTQLLNKLIDAPGSCVTTVERTPRKATEVAHEIRQTDQSRRRA